MIIESTESVDLKDGTYSGRLNGNKITIRGVVTTTRFAVNYHAGDVSHAVRVEIKNNSATVIFKYR